jgi:hypothetical protein
MNSNWKWVVGRGIVLALSATGFVACSEGASPEGDVQQVAPNAGNADAVHEEAAVEEAAVEEAAVEETPRTETERLAEERANTPRELMDALGDVTLGDGTTAKAVSVQEERAALIDRFNELKGALAQGDIAPEEANAMVAEIEELAARVRVLTEGQYQRSPAELESLKKADELAVSGTTLTPERMKQIEALQKEISPRDASRADEYAARKAEIFK